MFAFRPPAHLCGARLVLAAVLLAAAAAPQDRPPSDPFVAGREWRGRTREDGAIKKLRLVERRGATAVFEVDGFATGAVFRFEATVDGSSATVVAARRTKNPKGSGSVAMRDPRGRIRVTGERLTLSVTAQMRSSGALRTWTYTCDGAEPVAPGPPVDARDPFVVGKLWRGRTREDNQVKDIRVVERRGDVVVFEVDGFTQGATFRFEGTLKRDVVVIDNVRRTRTPKGHNAVAMAKPSGTIRQAPGGAITVHVEARVRSRRSMGWTFTCASAVEPR